MIAPSAVIADTVQIFAGTIVSDACEIGANVDSQLRLHRFAQCKDRRELDRGATRWIAGNVEIAEQVWIGVGATVKNGTSDNPLRIGRRAVIGAGACVVSDVAPDLP